MNKILFAVFVAGAITLSTSLDCSGVVTKEGEGVLNWLGNITFVAPVTTGPPGWLLTLRFDQVFISVGVFEGIVQYNGTLGWAKIQNRNSTDAEIVAGEQKSLRFRVNYGRDIPIPQVISLQFQDIELCN